MFTNNHNTRTHHFSWSDPLDNASKMVAMSGQERIQAMQNGSLLPPVMHMLGYTITSTDDQRTVLAFTPAEYHCNLLGTVHGGLISTIADTAIGLAVQATLPPGVNCTTLELHLNFVRPITLQTGRIRVTGELLHRGRTIVTAQSHAYDDDDTLYAHATSTYMILYPKNTGNRA